MWPAPRLGIAQTYLVSQTAHFWVAGGTNGRGTRLEGVTDLSWSHNKSPFGELWLCSRSRVLGLRTGQVASLQETRRYKRSFVDQRQKRKLMRL